MKKHLVVFFAGFLAGIVLLTSFNIQGADSFASISVVLNKVNVAINGITVGIAGEDFTLADGSMVPYSIVYKGTTYLPLRKVAELVDKEVSWDPNTNTAGINELPTTPIADEVSTESFTASGATVATLDNKFYYIRFTKGSTGVPFVMNSKGKKYAYSVDMAFYVTQLLEKKYLIIPNDMDDNPSIAGIIEIDKNYYDQHVSIVYEKKKVGAEIINVKNVTATYENGLILSLTHEGGMETYTPEKLFLKINPTEFYNFTSNALIDMELLCKNVGLPTLDVSYNPTLRKNVIKLDN